MRTLTIKFPIALCLACAGAYAQTEVRLLPQSFTESLSISWKRDGRVIDASVSNPKSKWVVEEVVIEVSYKSVKTAGDPGFTMDKTGKITPSKPKTKTKNGESVIDFNALMTSFQYNPTTTNNKVIIQPGATSSTHIELKADQANEVDNVRILEARGREQTTFERMRNFVN